MVTEFEALPALFHDEGRDAPGADVRRGDGKNHIGVRLGGVGDEDLAAVEDVVIPLEDGGGLGAAGVGAGVGLGEAKGADLLALDQGHQVFLLLLLGAVGKDGPGTQGHVGGQNDAGAAVHPGKLLHGDGVAQHVQAGSAVFLGVGDAHEPQLGQLLHGLIRELVLLVQQESDGLDLVFRKLPDLGPQGLMRVCGLEKHVIASFDIRWVEGKDRCRRRRDRGLQIINNKNHYFSCFHINIGEFNCQLLLEKFSCGQTEEEGGLR